MKPGVQFVLLAANHKNLPDFFIKSHYLFYGALFFITLTLLLLAATFYISLVKERKLNFNNGIRESVEQWITELLAEGPSQMTVPGEMMRLAQNKYARQMIIEELVRSKRSFLGSVSDNIIKLYTKLGFDIDSRNKLDDKRTYIQCQGIHEICVMEQKNQLRKIYRLTNGKDNNVRIEAQAAIIQWYGFSGLRFLDIVSFPITEFQQLKLLELLRHLPFTGLSNLDKWLQSPNPTVVNFALKLAKHYSQHRVHEASDYPDAENETMRKPLVRT